MPVYIVQEKPDPHNNVMFIIHGGYESAELAAEVASSWPRGIDIRVMEYPVIGEDPEAPVGARRAESVNPTPNMVWGPRENWAGNKDWGWLDLRDAPNDPELDEYIRLKKKFENPSQNAPGQQTPVDDTTTP